jgi:hypothetical protein
VNDRLILILCKLIKKGRFSGVMMQLFSGLFQGLPFVLQIQSFNLISGPRGFSQKFQAGLDTWIIIKTSDIDDSSHFIPAIMLYQLSKNHFQSYTVKRIVGLLVAHVPA